VERRDRLFEFSLLQQGRGQIIVQGRVAAIRFQRVEFEVVAHRAERDGQGFDLQHAGRVLALTWYTYDANGAPAWYQAVAEGGSRGQADGGVLRLQFDALDSATADVDAYVDHPGAGSWR
jgi:hypothetical protein